MTKPFSIDSKHIAQLTAIQLTQLLKELLHAEAYKFGLHQGSVEVALNINVGDGGEDGRIEWNGGIKRTDYIPNRLTMFQNKATKMGASKYANEITTTASKSQQKNIKPQVEDVFTKNGTYIVFTTQKLTKTDKKKRIKAIRNRLQEFEKTYANSCDIKIYDASQIAGWVNQFISTIVSVMHWTGTPTERGLKTFYLWREHENLSSLPFAPVESRRKILGSIIQNIETPKTCIRLMGLSGLGKTRTAFQIFKENKLLRSLVVYVDANHTPTIDALVSDWVGLGLRAIVIVDNCEYRLHERLIKEVRRENSLLSLLTIDYNIDSFSTSSICFKLSPMTSEELLTLLSPIYKDQLPDLNRVVAFAQGFPQMAVLLAEARLSEDPRIGELTEDDLAHRLLWRHGEYESTEITKILQACSLFDVFGVEHEVENQLEFIARLININIDKVFKCVKSYSDRGIIDRRGRFGQVVPKPLAIRLAGQWWAENRYQKKKELIDDIPESMVGSFCRQIEKLDFHTEVKKLTEKLCGPQGPFGQAEVILSTRGSNLFRAFVVVDPESTSEALYSTLISLPYEEVMKISGETRRNLVWALERLCYHANVFSKSAWCMMLLATAENESWSNNATGMFARLFRVTGSGTSANLMDRLALLNKALELNSLQTDTVTLEALSKAINTYGGYRMVGAEYQGSKPPIEEWHPKIWQEVFDYWEEAFKLLIILYDRGNDQKERVLTIVGNSIRTFVSHGRLEMLDKAIRYIVSNNGPYWPTALDSIKTTIKYDAEGARPEAIAALEAWRKLLSAENAALSDKLKIIVIDPPWENRRNKDGHYIDVAAENAKILAIDVSKNPDRLLPHLRLLLQGMQKQAYTFGVQLAIELDSIDPLLERIYEQLALIDNSNPSFLVGFFKGIYIKSPENWQFHVEKLLAANKLIYLYPDIVCTGRVQKKHLDILLALISTGKITTTSVRALSYGSVIEKIASEVIANFCLALAKIDSHACWIALEIIYMYCHSKKEISDALRRSLKKLVSTVPLFDESNVPDTDIYKWYDLAEKLLKERDQEFAIALANQLIDSSRDGLNHNDIWNYIKPLLLKLMRGYSKIIWPIFGDAIVHSEGMKRYWLQQILERENSILSKTPSVFSVIPVNQVISWCEKNPELGPSFVASTINILEVVDEEQRPTKLFVSLLEKFGDDKRVTSALNANMATRGWSGSLIPYLESDKVTLSPLVDHENVNVREWVKDHISRIDKQIDIEKSRDEEEFIGVH